MWKFCVTRLATTASRSPASRSSLHPDNARVALYLTPKVVPYLSQIHRPFSSDSSEDKLFNKLLVANRGEIACRILRTAKKLGIPTVAIYSDTDIEAPHVRLADEAVHVGPSPANESYRNVDRVMDAVVKAGADAVHPGYSFLSEKPEFAEKLKAQGVTFVGPTPEVMRLMTDKTASKHAAVAAGLQILPIGESIASDDDHAVELAKKVGFPVVLKSLDRGQSHVLRIATNAREVRDHYDQFQQDLSFKSPGAHSQVIVEHYLEKARLIEIQLVADKHGTMLWFPEREASIQRRYQKLIDESPSTFVDAATRKALVEQSVALAKSINYDTTGTVEFLLSQNKDIYFRGMSTRLHAGHVASECVTGVDIVELMLRAAAGQKLAVPQERIAQPNGWAIGARIYSDDPRKNFLPSSGKIIRYIEPAMQCSNEGILRIDSGVAEGDVITFYYHPLMSKVTTWAPTRNAAIDKMEFALDRHYIEGVESNIPFLRCIVSHPAFASGNITTNFIADNFPAGFYNDHLSPREESELAGISAFLHVIKGVRASATVTSDHPAADATAAAAAATLSQKAVTEHLVVAMDGQQVPVTLTHWPSDKHPVLRRAKVDVAGETMEVEERDPILSGKGLIHVSLDGKDATVSIREERPRGFSMLYHGCIKDEVLVQRADIAPLQKFMPKKKAEDVAHLIRTPMPGSVVKISVRYKQKVLPGDELVTIEAMKMRNVIRAEEAGIIRGIYVKEGQTVKVGEMLLDLDV
ncbi:hypothetical protein CLOM_g16582 [Closterium sp. NIES-68]|nr:hypothetical protein CLOM_g16582 [Closterium sp. NIES-68]GJP69329.1 hypothetical protein CLOP_g267 [Closterium sp. NIES-67]